MLCCKSTSVTSPSYTFLSPCKPFYNYSYNLDKVFELEIKVCPICGSTDFDLVSGDFKSNGLIVPTCRYNKCNFIFPKEINEDHGPIEIESPKETYIAVLETTLPDLDVIIKVLDKKSSSVLFEFVLDSDEVYLDEVDITDVIFTEDERYMIIVNFYYNPIQIWDTKKWELYFEIKDVKDVLSVKVSPENILLVEDGENNWVKWSIEEKRKMSKEENNVKENS